MLALDRTLHCCVWAWNTTLASARSSCSHVKHYSWFPWLSRYLRDFWRWNLALKLFHWSILAYRLVAKLGTIFQPRDQEYPESEHHTLHPLEKAHKSARHSIAFITPGTFQISHSMVLFFLWLPKFCTATEMNKRIHPNFALTLIFYLMHCILLIIPLLVLERIFSSPPWNNGPSSPI